MAEERITINTYSGMKMDPFDAQVAEINCRDIAHALSLLCRAGGHLKRFYSVGQHCICCCREAQKRGYSRRVQLLCLMHDASEAYIADITRPVKARLDEYRVLEDKLQKVILKACGLWPAGQQERKQCQEIDDAMLCAEFEALHPAGKLFDSPITLKELPLFEECLPQEIERQWLGLYRQLTEQEGE